MVWEVERICLGLCVILIVPLGLPNVFLNLVPLLWPGAALSFLGAAWGAGSTLRWEGWPLVVGDAQCSFFAPLPIQGPWKRFKILCR